MKVMTCQIEAVHLISSETDVFLSEASLELSLLCIQSANSSPTSPIPLSQLCLDLVSVFIHSCQLFKVREKVLLELN